MMHDVCNAQRLYDEFLEDLQEATLDILTSPALLRWWEDITLGLPFYATIEERDARYVTIGINVQI